MCVFVFRVETTAYLLNWFGKKKTVRRKTTTKVSSFLSCISKYEHLILCVTGHTPAETRNLKIIMN